MRAFLEINIDSFTDEDIRQFGEWIWALTSCCIDAMKGATP